MAARGVEYGVGTRNMFDLLGDDEEVDVNAKPKAVKKDEPSSKATNNKAPVVTSTKAPKTANKLSASLPPPDEPKRAPRPDDRAQRNGANRPPRRGGRGGAGAGGEGGSKKRQFDRRGPRMEGDQAKQGAGKYNWGNEKDQLELAEEISGGAAGDAPRRGRGDRGGRGRGGRGRGRGRGRGGRPDDQPADAAPKEGEEAPKPEDGQEAAPAEAAVEEAVQEFAPVDDEPKVKTFDEYLAEKKSKGLEEDQKREIRQPGEEQEGEWRAFAPLSKDGEEEKEEEEKSKPKKEKKAKQAVPKLSLDQFVGVQNLRGRGGRGGRTGPRNPNQRAPVDTEENFPSLKR